MKAKTKGGKIARRENREERIVARRRTFWSDEKRDKQESCTANDLLKNSPLYREFQAEREEILKHKWIESEKARHNLGTAWALWLSKRFTSTASRPLPRFWELFQFVLPHKTRREVYQPLYNEFLEDYLLARGYRTKWARRLLTFCFTWKTITMVVGCLRVALTGALGGVLLSLLPEQLRRFIARLTR